MTKDPNAFGLWEGEVTAELPKDFDASLYYIGRIHTPWKERKDCPKNARESEAVCTIEVDPRWAPALKDVESCSHLVVLYWMDRSRRDIVLQVPRHYGVQRGTFSLRSPARPNPIAMSVVRLLKVEGSSSRWSASTASTARRCSTSSPISPRPMRCPTRSSAGTRRGRAELRPHRNLSQIRLFQPEPNGSRARAEIILGTFEPFPRLRRRTCNQDGVRHNE